MKLEDVVSVSAAVIGIPYLMGYAFHYSYYGSFQLFLYELKLAPTEIFIGAFLAMRFWLTSYFGLFNYDLVFLAVMTVALITLIRHLDPMKSRKRVLARFEWLTAVYLLLLLFVSQVGSIAGQRVGLEAVGPNSKLPHIVATDIESYQVINASETTSSKRRELFSRFLLRRPKHFLIYKSDDTLFVLERNPHPKTDRLLRIKLDEKMIFYTTPGT